MSSKWDNKVTVSHHALRRTAAKLERHLEKAIRDRAAGNTAAAAALVEYNVPARAQHVRVESTIRGPFGWRVVATWD
jgi:hypothetical protein